MTVRPMRRSCFDRESTQEVGEPSDATPRHGRDDGVMGRTIIFAPLSDPAGAARMIADSGRFPDLILVAPAPSAREQVAQHSGRPVLIFPPGGSR